ncbi:MAG: type II toxin-antitoxin system RelE/ParE family toxin [Gammaproteobacteria bacterium]|nr:type II toxin-antitoxin system RelE/ParE family toxin [Gammaproteobacteria bacterium]
MSDVSVRFAESAVTDLEAIKEWYADQGVPDVGDRILGGVFERVERLQEHPDMGRVVPDFGESFLRELIYPPFRIVYHRGSKLVHVIRVWRSERLLVLPNSSFEE